jgi:hypothetical protein
VFFIAIDPFQELFELPSLEMSQRRRQNGQSERSKQGRMSVDLISRAQYRP